MAGDWGKWEYGLENKPEVVRIAAALRVTRQHAAALCMQLWRWADENIPSDTFTETGSAFVTLSPSAGDNMAFIDDVVGTPKFADSISSVGWLHFRNDRVEFPNFGRHNGETAKTRARNAKNQQKKRNNSGAFRQPQDPPKQPGLDGSVTKLSPIAGDKKVTREEERREESNKEEKKKDAAVPDFIAPKGFCINPAVTAIEVDGDILEYHEDALKWEAEFVRRWNLLPGVNKRTSSGVDEALRRSLQARLMEPQWFWKRAMGEFPLPMDIDWKPNLSWFLKPDSVSKILDGSFQKTTKLPKAKAAVSDDIVTFTEEELED